MNVVDSVVELAGRVAVRAALAASSLATGRLFWVQAALGRNQLAMHDCTPDGRISIGGVSEQLYGEGFIAAWHEAIGRAVGPRRLKEVLYEAGARGAEWEVGEALRHGTWVPALLRPFVGTPELLVRARESAAFRALARETFRIFLRMIVTEGGWGVVEDLDLAADPIVLRCRNTPEPRRLGPSREPACLLFAGICAGYFRRLVGVDCEVRERECEAQGHEACVFEVSVVDAARLASSGRAAAADRASVARDADLAKTV